MTVREETPKMIARAVEVSINGTTNDLSNEVHLGPNPEPIAICGIGLRLPGGIRTSDAFWDVLHNGRDLRGPIPADRFNMDAFDDSLGSKGAIKTRHGYFLDEDLGSLDASFFNMTKLELEKTDPQERKALEVAWECLENAGETNWRGKPIGVYVGTFGDDWQQILSEERQITQGYNLSGDLMIANRISYEFDFQGPSLVVKTGCSASLVSVHEACRALQQGDCSGALVCGTSLLMGPHNFIVMTNEGVLSPEGSCKTFDASADGFARADGINAIYLKRLPDALRDGNPIRAIIRNSGNNSDGRSKGLLSPRSSTQEALMRHVYAQARLDPADTGFIECHGTGTPTGDPIETTAIGNVFGKAGIYIGSVKPNTGHSEGASGLTGLIKAVLALEHLTIPPNIKFIEPNPKIPFAEKKLVVPTVPTPWPKGRAERVSVNSFGIGGSNAHVIVESAKQFLDSQSRPKNGRRLTPAATCSVGPRLLLFSANATDSVENFAQWCISYCQRNPANLTDLVHTLSHKREKLRCRSFAVVSASGTVGMLPPVVKTPTRSHPLVMIFSGQGAQWPQMGRDLLLSHPVFSQSIDEMNNVLESLTDAPGWSLKDELLKPDHASRVHEAEMSQPLTTAVQLGLFQVLRQLGVTPQAVIGHSSGEIAAAHAAGLLSIRQAIIISYLRGLATRSRTRDGGMAAVGLGARLVQPYLVDGVVVAAENSPGSTTISGDVEVLDQVLASIKADHPDTLGRRLLVDMAYHSPHMNVVGKEYAKLLRQELGPTSTSLPPNPSRTAMFSTVTTRLVTQPLDVTYWIDNLTSPVKFCPAFSNMLSSLGALPLCVELGPHSQMAGPIRQTCAADGVQSNYVPTMIRSASCTESLLSALGQLFQQDVALEPSADLALFPPGKTLTDLPPYDWDHSVKHWFENRVSQDWRFRKYGHHALLGDSIPESSTLEPAWRCVLDLEDEPWLKDHVVATNIVFPFAGYITMAGEAIRQVSGVDTGFRIKHAIVHTALVLSENTPVELMTTFRRRKLTDKSYSDYYDFIISSFSGSVWTRHCEGSVMALDRPKRNSESPKTLPRKVSASRWYEIMDKVGLTYGESFRGIESLEASATDFRAIAGISETAKGSFLFHPATMDSAFQLVIAAGAKCASRNLTELVVPTLVMEMEVFAAGGRMIAEAWASPEDRDIGLVCTAGEHVALRVKGVRLTPLENNNQSDTERHKAARMEFFPDIDFLNVSSLVGVPTADRRTRAMLEEIVLLSILHLAERVEHLEPCKPHYRKYREWLFRERKRALDGVYPAVETNAPHFTALSTQQRLDEINSRLSNMSEDATFGLLVRGICKLNQSCDALFTGEIDVLDLLMEDNLLTGIYNSVSLDFSKYVKLLCIKKPTLRVLEVGAGTGGATELILRDLVDTSKNPPYSVYTFTDISAGFFSKASERFKYAPNMEYKVLDISQDPLSQGFQAETYDLILANNVVHATENLGVTLSHLRSLLRPDGRLLLSELSATAAKAPGLVFGQFSGWWMGEADGRTWEPFVPIDRWARELTAAGFTGVDTAVFDEDEPFQYCVGIVSRSAPQMTNTPTTAPGHEAITVLCDKPNEGPTVKLITDLMSRGYDIVVRKFGDLPLPPDRPILVTLDLEGYFYQDLTSVRFAAFQEICRQHQGQKLLWLMPLVQIGCVDPRYSQTIGALRITGEELSLPFYTLELAESEPAFTDLITNVLRKIVGQDDVEALSPDKEFVVEDGVVKIGRCQPFSLEQEMASLAMCESTVNRLAIGKPGLLETLDWVTEGPNPLEADDVEIEAKAVGLNFRDIMVAMGILTFGDGPPLLGLEMAGVVSRVGSAVQHIRAGDRVIAVADGCFSTKAVAKSPLVVKIPENLGFEDASTMPTVFCTAIQALVHVARLDRGQSVLIHSACGGIGHAAVQICKNAGAEIYVTVGSDVKADYAEKTFGIPKTRIFNSRDDSFLDDVMLETDGKGVDIVLNSLSGKLLHASWRCVAEFGQLIEIGKRDLVDFGSLDLEPFLKNRSYCCVDLAHMFDRRPNEAGKLLQGVVDLFRDGKIQPIKSRAEYSAQDIELAFRRLQHGGHIGKVIVKMPYNCSDLPATPKPAKISFDSSATYIITGGLGGVGKSVASWMAEHGARNLVFLSRSAGKGQNDKSFFAELEELGCTAVPVPGQVQTMEDVERAITLAPTPVKGVIHLAMVLRDGSATNLTFEEWTAVTAPKVNGAWNLHNAFIQRAQSLDFFVVSSSIATVAQHPGQSNYAAANSFLEAFVQYRRRLGLAAAAVGLCAVDDVGFVADNPIVRRKLRSQGLHFLPEREMLEYFQFSLLNQRDHEHHDTARDALASWANHGYTIAGLHSEVHLDDPSCPTLWRRNRKMGMYHNLRATSDDAGSDASGGLKAFLESAGKHDDPEQFLLEDTSVDYLATEIGLRISQIMMRDTTDMDVSMSAIAMGMDSLMAIELRRWWKQSFGVDVTLLEIMGAGTLRRLGRVASEGLRKKMAGKS